MRVNTTRNHRAQVSLHGHTFHTSLVALRGTTGLEKHGQYAVFSVHHEHCHRAGSTSHNRSNVIQYKVILDHLSITTMNPLQIARLLALCVALMVAPLQAQDQKCDDIFQLAFTTMIKERTHVFEKCRSMSRMEAFYGPPLSTCTILGCVDAIKKSLPLVPSCIVSYGYEAMNAKTLVLAAAKMCENEARDGNLLIPADDGSDGSDSTDSGSEDDDLCTSEELDEISKLRNSEECQAVCGLSTGKTLYVQDSPLCSRPECKAYYKDVLLKKAPRCRFFGSVRYSIALCDAAPETMPSHSVTTMLRVLFMVVVAVTAVVMA